MRNAVIIMAAAVLACGMEVGQAFGDDENIPNDNFTPMEADGFNGTLLAKVRTNQER